MELIEMLIHTSCELSQAALYARAHEGDKEKADVLEAQGIELWTKARKLGDSGVSERNYEDLANAVIENAVRDYIALLGGTAGGRRESSDNNPIEIRKFIKNQTWSKVNGMKILDTADRVYRDEFVPYVKEHAVAIVSDYQTRKKKRMTIADYAAATTHRCPFCKGGIYPRTLFSDIRKQHISGYKIGCQYCGMSIEITEREVRKNDECATA